MQSKQCLKGFKFDWAILVFSIATIAITPFLTPSLAGISGGFTVILTLLYILKYSINSVRCKLALFLGFLLLFVYVVTCFIPLHYYRLKAMRVQDFQNLKEVGISIKKFKHDYGVLPSDLGQLLDDGYIKDVRVLVSPAQKIELPLNGADVRKGRCAYLYWGNKINDMNPETPIACSIPGLLNKPAMFKKGFLELPWYIRTICGDNYIAVLYLDGHVEGFLNSPDEVKKIIEYNTPSSAIDKIQVHPSRPPSSPR